ncbi:MAG: DUF4426 domain-containing protein [Gammaproteobacteria bacterium]
MNANRVTPTLTLFAGLFAAFVLTGCGNSGSATSLNDAPEAREAPKTSQEFADHIVHFNAITSDQVSPENAAKYGISRSRSNALLNVVILAKQDGGGTKPMSGEVAVKTSNLTGQLKNVTLREITEGDAIYYIGVVPVANNETLNFEITATPAGSTGPLLVKYQQQFFTK